MFDVISRGLAAASTQSPYAIPLVFAAGVASSVGPCVAPRFVAVAGMTAGKSHARTAVLASAFVAGLCLVYAAFGAAAPLLSRAAQFSPYTYGAVAASLAVAGCSTLWRGQQACAHSYNAKSKCGAGAALLLGASFALVVSPCCAPIVGAILAYASAGGSAAYASTLLASFALGHALPVLAVAFGVNGMTGMLQRYTVREAAGVVGSALMLGLAAYYAVLA